MSTFLFRGVAKFDDNANCNLRGLQGLDEETEENKNNRICSLKISKKKCFFFHILNCGGFKPWFWNNNFLNIQNIFSEIKILFFIISNVNYKVNCSMSLRLKYYLSMYIMTKIQLPSNLTLFITNWGALLKDENNNLNNTYDRRNGYGENIFIILYESKIGTKLNISRFHF